MRNFINSILSFSLNGLFGNNEWEFSSATGDAYGRIEYRRSEENAYLITGSCLKIKELIISTLLFQEGIGRGYLFSSWC